MEPARRTLLTLRNKLLLVFFVLVVGVGVGTLLWIEHTLANDLLSSLDKRLEDQGKAVAAWLQIAGGDVDALTGRLAKVTGARVTIVGSDGLVEGDSLDAALVGRPTSA